ncbi:hypothetical protein ACLB1O_05445 [Escherichia coli]
MVITTDIDLFTARKLAARYKFPLLNPLLVTMVVMILNADRHILRQLL